MDVVFNWLKNNNAHTDTSMTYLTELLVRTALLLRCSPALAFLLFLTLLLLWWSHEGMLTNIAKEKVNFVLLKNAKFKWFKIPNFRIIAKFKCRYKLKIFHSPNEDFFQAWREKKKLEKNHPLKVYCNINASRPSYFNVWKKGNLLPWIVFSSFAKESWNGELFIFAFALAKEVSQKG